MPNQPPLNPDGIQAARFALTRSERAFGRDGKPADALHVATAIVTAYLAVAQPVDMLGTYMMGTEDEALKSHERREAMKAQPVEGYVPDTHALRKAVEAVHNETYGAHGDLAHIAVNAYTHALHIAQPEVNSVEELDALPHGTVIMATGGNWNPQHPELFLKCGYAHAPWMALDPSDRDDGENLESSGAVLRWRCDDEARVLYRPEVNDGRE